MSQHDPLLVELGLSPLWVSRARADALAGSSSQADAQGEARTAVADTGHDPARENLEKTGVDSPLQVVGTDIGQAGIKPSEMRLPKEKPFGSRPADAGRSEVPASAALSPDDQRPHSPASDAMPFDAFDTQDDFAGYETAMFERVDFVPPGDIEPSTQPSAQPSVATLDFAALRERVASCTACGLCAKRTQTVFGVGDEQADWMIVGEAPGENEDRLGEPFVGQAGKLLDNMLRSVTLNRTQNVYIANVIKCRPPGNRNPQPDEVARCEPYLKRQVALVRPKLILALGRFAAQTLLKSEASISSLRGRVHQYEGVPVIVSYHPAYLLRSLPEKSKAWADLCLAQATFRQAVG